MRDENSIERILNEAKLRNNMRRLSGNEHSVLKTRTLKSTEMQKKAR